jgi:Na+-transporting methylmalonyl-CoA/oxaloacetate decarboxylase gamma subunit
VTETAAALSAAGETVTAVAAQVTGKLTGQPTRFGEFNLTDTFITAVTGMVVVLSILAFLSIIIRLVSRGFIKAGKKSDGNPAAKPKKAKAQTQKAASVSAVMPQQVLPAIAALPAPVQLSGVTEPTAAVIMALVAHKTGIPLDRLAFKSIKLAVPELETDADDPTSAVIMALVSDQTKIPLDRLVFKSIKLLED